VIICCVRIVTKSALPPTRTGQRSSTALYFALSGLLSLACFVVYHSVLPRLEVVKYYKQKRQDASEQRILFSSKFGKKYGLYISVMRSPQAAGPSPCLLATLSSPQLDVPDRMHAMLHIKL
jgi:hypothetical protein